MSSALDVIVVGGGLMGSAAALQLAEGGMRVALCEARQLAMGASGVNAGTLSMQTKRVPLIPYALRGYEWWKRAGDAVGFKETGSLTLAYTQAEAEGLAQRMSARRNAGAPIEMITATAAHALEPGLREGLAAASYCAADGYANSSLTGSYYRARLRAAGAEVHELTPVQAIIPLRKAPGLARRSSASSCATSSSADAGSTSTITIFCWGVRRTLPDPNL